MTYLPARTDLFGYFCEQLGDYDWSGRTVLDFGGSEGGLLRDPAATIDEERYCCIDIARGAIERGRRDFPAAHWLFYDRYSQYYNPGGLPDLEVPDPGRRFDIIAAYSVFTSIRTAEMMTLVPQLEALLAPRGTLAFTFIDPHFHSWPKSYPGNNLQWRLEKEQSEGADIDIAALLARAHGASECTLLSNSHIYADDEQLPAHPKHAQKTCHVYYTAQRMAALFPAATIEPPAGKEMQHCCLIRAA